MRDDVSVELVVHPLGQGEATTNRGALPGKVSVVVLGDMPAWVQVDAPSGHRYLLPWSQVLFMRTEPDL